MFSAEGYTGGWDTSETTAPEGSGTCGSCVTCDTPGADPKLVTTDGDPTGGSGNVAQDRPAGWTGSAGGAGGSGGGGTGGTPGQYAPNAHSATNIPINLGKSNNPNGTLPPVMQAQIIFRSGNLETDAASIKNMKSPADIGGDLRWATFASQSCVRQWLGNGCLADVQPINSSDLNQGTRIRLYNYSTTPAVSSGLYVTTGLTEFRRIDIRYVNPPNPQLIVENFDDGGSTITRDWTYTRTGSAPNYNWSLAERVLIGGSLKKVREQTVVGTPGDNVRTHYELAGFTGTTPILATTSVTRTTFTTFTLADGSLARRPTQRIRYEDAAGTVPVSRIDWTYYDTDTAHAASYGRAKTRRDYIYNSNGTNYLSFWEDYAYDRPVGSSVQTTTIYRSWHGSPEANYTQALKIHRVEMPLPTVSGMNRLDYPERYIIQTLSVDTQTLSYVTNVVTADTTDITVTQTVAADANNYTIVRKYYGVSADAHKRYRLKEILQPDSTLTTYDYATEGDARKHIVKSGWRTGGGDQFHTQSETTYNRQGFQIKQVVTDLATSLITSHSEVVSPTTEVDSYGRPTKVRFNQDANEYKTIAYGCCGLDEVREVDGRVTKYELDELKRLKSVKDFFGKSSQVQTSYSYARRMNGSSESGGLSVTRTRDGVGLSVLIDTVERDASKRLRTTIYPDANADPTNSRETATVTYTALTDGKLTVTETIPITTGVNSSSSTTAFGDGSIYEISGPSVADTRFEYGTWDLGVSGRYGLTVARIALSASGATTERVTSFTDLAGRLVATRQSLGVGADADTYYEYSTSTNQLLRQTDPDGVMTLFGYNVRGERYRSAVDLNDNFTIDLGADRISESETSVVNDVVSGGVGVAFKTESRVYFPGGASTPTIISSSWTAVDGQAGRTDAQGSKTSWTEERFGGTADPANGIWSRTTIQFDGSKSVSKYDLWRPKREEFQDKGSNIISWSEVTRYDPVGRADKFKQSRNNQETELTFFENGNVRTEKNISANETTTYIRDPLGRVIQVQLPGGAGSQYKAYTLAGQLFKEWGKLQYPVRYSYDEHGRMKTMDTFRGLTAGAAPPDTGGSPDTTTWNYNAYSGRLYEKVYADGKKTQYTYTKAGRVATRTWARSAGSVVTTYKYALASWAAGDDSAVSNVYGGLTKVDYSDSTPDVSYVHDRLGRLTSVTDAIGTRTFAYVSGKLYLESENHPSSFPGTTGAVIKRLYEDGSGTTVSNRYKGFEVNFGVTTQFTNTYGYDDAGRLVSVSDGAGVIGTYSYTSNSASMVSTLTRQTGTAGALVATNTWMPYHDRLDVVANTLAGTSISSYDYTVNALGQRTSVSASGSAFSGITGASWSTWGYNDHGEVTGATHASDATRNRTFIYDSIGNRKNSRIGSSTAVGYEVNTPNSTNKYTAFFTDTDNDGVRDAGESTTASPVHDDDGNMIDDGGSGTTGRTFIWDAENRLIQVKDKSTTPKLLATYSYDYRGRRVKKETTADAVQGATKIAYLYDGWNVIAEYDLTAGNPSTTPTKRHDWGLDLSGTLQGASGVGGLIRTKIASTSYLLTYDGSGNIVELVNAADGTFGARYHYDLFGNIIYESGSAATSSLYRFNSKPVDRESGLCYYGYRYYSPAMGRWLNRDPLEEEGGANLYGFVLNDPANWYDDNGMKPQAVSRHGKGTIKGKKLNRYTHYDKHGDPVKKGNKESECGCSERGKELQKKLEEALQKIREDLKRMDKGYVDGKFDPNTPRPKTFFDLLEEMFKQSAMNQNSSYGTSLTMALNSCEKQYMKAIYDKSQDPCKPACCAFALLEKASAFTESTYIFDYASLIPNKPCEEVEEEERRGSINNAIENRMVSRHKKYQQY